VAALLHPERLPGGWRRSSIAPRVATAAQLSTITTKHHLSPLAQVLLVAHLSTCAVSLSSHLVVVICATAGALRNHGSAVSGCFSPFTFCRWRACLASRLSASMFFHTDTYRRSCAHHIASCRMYRDPDEATEEAVAKLDRAAASRRSTIRRETTVRPGRYSSSSSSERLRDVRRDHFLERARVSVHDEEREANQQIAELEAELGRLRTIRHRHRVRLDREISRNRREMGSRSENILLRDAMELLNHSRPTFDDENSDLMVESGSTTRDALPAPAQHLNRPPARESGLRFEVAAVASRSGSASPRRQPVSIRRFMPSPPYSSGSDRRDRTPPDGPLALDEDGPAGLTPGFAPARGPYIAAQDLDRATLIRSVHHHLPGEDEVAALETPPPETWEASYSPLRRVNHMSPRLSVGISGSRVDGLGDRLRSPSPLSDTHEEETWANLLTTMDSGRSSNSTSFLSSRSDFAPRSNRSSQVTTTTSFGEIGQGDESCDLDLPSGITEEDVREIRARHRQMTGSARGLPPPPALPSDGPVGDFERAGREYRERREPRRMEGLLQTILEHMRRREDIPDELWAAVGLSPDIARGNT